MDGGILASRTHILHLFSIADVMIAYCRTVARYWPPGSLNDGALAYPWKTGCCNL